MSTIPCAGLACREEAMIVCEHCARRLCGGCYGSGSSSFCHRCFYALRREVRV